MLLLNQVDLCKIKLDSDSGVIIPEIDLQKPERKDFSFYSFYFRNLDSPRTYTGQAVDFQLRKLNEWCSGVENTLQL
jgi:hypothetical protein